MRVSSRKLAALAAETGFRRETLEKVIRLGELLEDIARHPFLSKALALKGGTALNECVCRYCAKNALTTKSAIFSSPRFSRALPGA